MTAGGLRWRLALAALLFSLALVVHGGEPAPTHGVTAQPGVEAWFFWSQSCPHCIAAHPHVLAIAENRPWLRLHALEISRQPENLALYESLASRIGAEAVSVPAMIFCGEIHVGWDEDATTGALLRQRLDACRGRAGAQMPASTPAAEALRLPLIGTIDPGSLSLPVLTLVLAGLDAFNPCALPTLPPTT